MPEREPRKIPEWAKRERASDLAWIAENLHVFFPAARAGFEQVGRGAIVTDTTTLVKHERGESHPFAYVPSEEIYKGEWLDAIRMVREYDPSWEFVAVLLKQGRESAYRIGVPAQRK
jgi:hypothetical protein